MDQQVREKTDEFPGPTSEGLAASEPSDKSDVMRHNYRELSNEDASRVTGIKNIGAALHAAIDDLPPSREASLAKTKVEECVMWAVKAITG